MADHDNIKIEYLHRYIAEDIPITMTMADWLQLLGQYELIGENLSIMQRKLAVKIWEVVTTAAYRQAAKAHIAEHQNQIPEPILKLMRMSGQIPDTDDDNPFD